MNKRRCENRRIVARERRAAQQAAELESEGYYTKARGGGAGGTDDDDGGAPGKEENGGGGAGGFRRRRQERTGGEGGTAPSVSSSESERICLRACPDAAELPAFACRICQLAVEYRNTHLDYIIAVLANPLMLEDEIASRPCGPLDLFYPHGNSAMTVGQIPDVLSPFVSTGVLHTLVRPSVSAAPAVQRAIPVAFSTGLHGPRASSAAAISNVPGAMRVHPSAERAAESRICGIAAAAAAAEGYSADLVNARAMITPAFRYLERTVMEASFQGLYGTCRVAPSAGVAIVTHEFFTWQRHGNAQVLDLSERTGDLHIVVLREFLAHYCAISPIVACAVDRAVDGEAGAYATTITRIMDTVRAARNAGVPISKLVLWIKKINTCQTPFRVPAAIPVRPPPSNFLARIFAVYDKQRATTGTMLWGNPHARVPTPTTDHLATPLILRCGTDVRRAARSGDYANPSAWSVGTDVRVAGEDLDFLTSHVEDLHRRRVPCSRR
jgi:hypothetical protein